MNNIILCGFKSSGKSTLAQKIALKTGLHYIDTDHLVAKNCRDVYFETGPDAFRRMEKEVIAALHEFQNAVIATGGGSLLDPDNATALKKLGKLFYLRVPPEELKKRILCDPLPAFLDPQQPEASFEQMYRSRVGIYENIADYIIDTEDQLWSYLSLELNIPIS